MGKTFKRVSSRNELLTYESLVVNIKQGLHYWRVVDFLFVVQFTATRVARRMDVTDVLSALVNTPNNVSIHNLYMINIKKKLQLGRTHFFDNIDAIIDMISLVTRMPFVWIGVVT